MFPQLINYFLERKKIVLKTIFLWKNESYRRHISVRAGRYQLIIVFWESNSSFSKITLMRIIEMRRKNCVLFSYYVKIDNFSFLFGSLNILNRVLSNLASFL